MKIGTLKEMFVGEQRVVGLEYYLPTRFSTTTTTNNNNK